MFVLTIAGTDPSGAAGIQADCAVIHAHGLEAASVITAVLAQGSVGVRAVYPMEAAMIAAQLDSVLSDLPVTAVKIGLVPTPQAAEAIARGLERLGQGVPVVLDPVLASGDGRSALVAPGTPGALLDLIAGLAPRLTILTPNAPEAAALAGLSVVTGEEAMAAALALGRYARGVLLKAGHLTRGDGWLRDVWAMDGEAALLAALPAIEEDVRGTGCHLSSAIAARLARGEEALAAVEGARRYLGRLLHEGRWRPGHGRMMIRHTGASWSHNS